MSNVRNIEIDSELEAEVMAKFTSLASIDWDDYCAICEADYAAEVARDSARAGVEPDENEIYSSMVTRNHFAFWTAQ